MLRLEFVVSANDEGLAVDNGNEKTVETHIVDKSMIESKTNINSSVFKGSEHCPY